MHRHLRQIFIKTLKHPTMEYVRKKVNIEPMLILLYFITLGCSNNERQNSFNLPNKYSIVTTDTLSIPFKGKLINAIDFNKTNGDILFCDIAKIDTIYQTDSLGNLINKKSLLGEGPSFAGTSIYNLGYWNDSTIMVNGSNGFLFFDLKFNLLKSIYDKTPLSSYGAGITPRIRHINKNQLKYGIFHLKNSFTGNVLSEEGYKKYKAITIYNFESKQNTFIGGYEKENIHFGDPLHFFDISKDSLLYSLHSPDLNLYKYHLTNSKTKYLLTPLYPSHFSLPISYKVGQTSNDNLDQDIVNSQFTDLNCYKGLTFITYRTGIDIDEFKKTKTTSELPELFKNHMKYYTIIVENNTQKSADIQLMNGAAGIGFVKSLDYILINTNPIITETENSTLFFICKLISH